MTEQVTQITVPCKKECKRNSVLVVTFRHFSTKSGEISGEVLFRLNLDEFSYFYCINNESSREISRGSATIRAKYRKRLNELSRGLNENSLV